MSRKIEDLIVRGHWAIDLDWGLTQLSQYHQQISLLKSGVPFAELGLSKSRQASRLLTFTDNSNSTVRIDGSDLDSMRKLESGTVARMNLSGPMSVEDGLCSRGIQSMCGDMEMLDSLKTVDALIIEANTGGGESQAGHMLKSAIEDFSKPVIFLSHFLGSAGVMSSLTADQRIASSNGAKIGSIGSYFSIDKEFVEWYKENVDDIYSRVSPEKNKDFRDYIKGDSSGFEDSATESAAMFISEVKKHLKLDKATAKETLQGGMFYAKDAKKRGLVDSIGGMKHAIKRARALAK